MAGLRRLIDNGKIENLPEKKGNDNTEEKYQITKSKSQKRNEKENSRSCKIQIKMKSNYAWKRDSF
jgi:hypothetical protein